MIAIGPSCRQLASNKIIKDKPFCDFSHLFAVDVYCVLNFRGSRVADGDGCQYGGFPVGVFLIWQIMINVPDDIQKRLNNVHGIRYYRLKIKDKRCTATRT